MTATPADNPIQWTRRPTLTGRLVRLEPLGLEHAPGILRAAQADDAAEEVFRWMGVRPPRDAAGAVAHIGVALQAMADGTRYPLVQVDVASGGVIGSTSLYEVVPQLRTLPSAHLARLAVVAHRAQHRGQIDAADGRLRHPGPVRIVWHTDIHNVRSQAAIARLGATREGVLRKHRIRVDATWRDTIQYSMTDDDWPAVRRRLAGRFTE